MTYVKNKPSVAPYPEYVSSGEDWLGDIPAHWELKRLKYSVTSCQNGIWGEEPQGNETDVICVRVADFDRNKAIVSTDNLTTRSVPLTKFTSRQLKRGDLLLEKSGGGDLQPVGFVVVFDHDFDAVCSNFVASMRPGYKYNSQFLNYLHDALYYLRVNTRSIKQNTGIQNLDSNAYLNEKAGFPPLGEQQAIAAYLDYETAKIDSVIAKKERLVRLLAEKRAAIITNVATFGLDDKVMTRTTDIPWLRVVPAHWKTKPIKYLVRMRSGGTPDKSRADYWNGDIPWASAKDLKVDMLHDTEDHITDNALVDGQAKIIKESTVIIVVRGMILAHTFPVTVNAVPMAINQDLKALKPSNEIDLHYLAWQMRGLYKTFLSRTDEAGHGTKTLRVEDWNDIALAVPPIDEQKKIVGYIEQETQRIDTMAEKVRRQIKVLREYRKTLITKAVTGKIDVRSYEMRNGLEPLQV